MERRCAFTDAFEDQYDDYVATEEFVEACDDENLEHAVKHQKN